MESTTPHHNSIDHRFLTLLDLVVDTSAVVIFTRDSKPVATLTPVEPNANEGSAILTLAQEDLFGFAPTVPADDA